MNFGEALELAKQGKLICREGWNGKNQFVFLIKKENLAKCFDETVLNVFEVTPTLAIKTAAGQIQVGWLASQSDMLSADWEEFKFNKGE